MWEYLEYRSIPLIRVIYINTTQLRQAGDTTKDIPVATHISPDWGSMIICLCYILMVTVKDIELKDCSTESCT